MTDCVTPAASFDELREKAKSRGFVLLVRGPRGSEPQYVLRTGERGGDGEFVTTDLDAIASRIDPPGTEDVPPAHAQATEPPTVDAKYASAWVAEVNNINWDAVLPADVWVISLAEGEYWTTRYNFTRDLDDPTLRTWPTKAEAVAAVRKKLGRMPRAYRAVQLTLAQAALVKGEAYDTTTTQTVPQVTNGWDGCTAATENLFDPEPYRRQDEPVVNGEVVDLPAVVEEPTDLSEASLPVLTATAERYHAECEAGQRTAVVAAWFSGTYLLEIKRRLGHGKFLPWLGEHSSIHERTAQRYMAVASNTTRVSDLNPKQSIRQNLESLCAAPKEPESGSGRRREPKPKRSDPPDTKNPFLKPFYRHVSQMWEHGQGIKKVMNSKKFPDHQHEVFGANREFIGMAEKVLAEVLDLLHTYTQQETFEETQS